MDAAPESSLANPGICAVALEAPLRIAFVITDLDRGGAEVMLWKLLSRIDRTRFAPTVVVLRGGAASMLEEFRGIGADCELLDWRPGGAPLRPLRQLMQSLRALKPHVVQGWMYHANIAATLAVALTRLRAPVLWNIRQSLSDLEREKPLTRALIWAGGKLSRSAAAIVNNSEASAVQHEQQMGYRAATRVIVPNGFDTDVFHPSSERKAALRAELRVSDDAVLVGLIGRYHVVKGHDVFLAAAALVARSHPATRFVMAGDGIDAANVELQRLIERSGLRDRVHLLGQRTDMAAVMSGLDINVSASAGEGFPNVVGEAMSCGVPCVVTDVGDCAAIVGDTGVTVPAADPQKLAQAIAGLVALGPGARAALGLRARQRAIERFSLDAVVRQYEDLYTRIHSKQRSA